MIHLFSHNGCRGGSNPPRGRRLVVIHFNGEVYDEQAHIAICHRRKRKQGATSKGRRFSEVFDSDEREFATDTQRA